MQLVAFDYNFIPNIENSTEFSIYYKPITRIPADWYQECLNTAKYISSLADKPIAIAFSGGIDSEVVCRSFLSSNIPFTPIIFKHVDNANYHDITYALQFCNKNNLKPIILDFDVDEFLNEKIPKYIEQGYKNAHIFRYVQLFYLEIFSNMNFCGVLGGGEQIYCTANKQVSIKYDKGMLNSLEWIKEKNLCHFPYFFQTTPEIVAAYLKTDLINMLVQDERYFKEDLMYSVEKILVYHYYWQDMKKRPKFNGYENCSKKTFPVNSLLKEQYSTSNLFISVSTIKEQLQIES
jgi:hypothetical protein